LSVSQSPIRLLFVETNKANDPVLQELVGKLKSLSARGFIPSERAGDTAIGFTLEKALGIEANSSKNPDYKGIELKSKRRSSSSKSTLFSKVPNWKLSPVESAWNLLSRFGYSAEHDLQLYCTNSGKSPNPNGFQLEVDERRDWLKQNFVGGATGSAEHLVTWELTALRSALAKKHRKTLWIKALVNNTGRGEEFHFTDALFTSDPFLSQLGILFSQGTITVDYTMHRKSPPPSQAVRDHGYLFRISPSSFHLLFSPPVTFDLTV
jgi:hypothetical protein